MQIETYGCDVSLMCVIPLTAVSAPDDEILLRFVFGTIIYLRPATMATDCGGGDLISLFNSGFFGAILAALGGTIVVTLLLPSLACDRRFCTFDFCDNLLFVLLFLRDASLPGLFVLINDFVISFDNLSIDVAFAVAVALVSIELFVDAMVVAVVDVADFAFVCASTMHFCELKIILAHGK